MKKKLKTPELFALFISTTLLYTSAQNRPLPLPNRDGNEAGQGRGA